MKPGTGPGPREKRFDLAAFVATGVVAGVVGTLAWLMLAVGFGALVASLALLTVVGGGGWLLAGAATRRGAQFFAVALLVSFAVALFLAAGPIADAVR